MSVVSTPIFVACVCNRFVPSKSSTSDVRTGSLAVGVADANAPTHRLARLADDVGARATRGVETRRVSIALLTSCSNAPQRREMRVLSSFARATASIDTVATRASFARARVRACASSNVDE
jgi:hypothetical protein